MGFDTICKVSAPICSQASLNFGSPNLYYVVEGSQPPAMRCDIEKMMSCIERMRVSCIRRISVRGGMAEEQMDRKEAKWTQPRANKGPLKKAPLFLTSCVTLRERNPSLSQIMRQRNRVREKNERAIFSLCVVTPLFKNWFIQLLNLRAAFHRTFTAIGSSDLRSSWRPFFYSLLLWVFCPWHRPSQRMSIPNHQKRTRRKVSRV